MLISDDNLAVIELQSADSTIQTSCPNPSAIAFRNIFLVRHPASNNNAKHLFLIDYFLCHEQKYPHMYPQRVEINQEQILAAPQPPVRTTITPPPPAKSWFNPWWLLLLLCCIPLCFLPCLCCKSVKKYMPGALAKPQRTDAGGQKIWYRKKKSELIPP